MLDTPTEDEEIPNPEEVFVDPTNPRSDEVIDALEDVGLLTERQAEAYVRRVLDLEPREAVSNDLGISASTLDDHRGDALGKVTAARKTVAILDAYRSPELPSECTDCGTTLGGSWVGGEDGGALCYDCAGIDTDDALPS